MHVVALEPGTALEPEQDTLIEGDEARHAARVKRLGVGRHIGLTDGRGTMATAEITAITRTGMAVRITEVRHIEPVSPRIEVCSAAPKGDRLSTLIEQLSEVGAASWSPLAAEHAVVKPRESKLDRLRRVATESAKQCARAWTLEIGDEIGFDAAIEPSDGRVVVADASGGPYRPVGARRLRVVVGPEGGWSAEELVRARTAGVIIASFGPHVMRIGTAAVVAASAVLAAEQQGARS